MVRVPLLRMSWPGLCLYPHRHPPLMPCFWQRLRPGHLLPLYGKRILPESSGLVPLGKKFLLQKDLKCPSEKMALLGR